MDPPPWAGELMPAPAAPTPPPSPPPALMMPPGGTVPAAKRRRGEELAQEAAAAPSGPRGSAALGPFGINSCAATLEEDFQALHASYDHLSQSITRQLTTFRNYESQVRTELEREREELNERAQKLDRLLHRLQLFTGCGGEQVALDVGGKRFDTTWGTLCAVPDTLFTVMLAGEFAVERTAAGAIRLDRDPAFFNVILNYLRDRRDGRNDFNLKGLSKADAARIADEASFYGIDALKRLAINCTALVVSGEVDAPYSSVNAALCDAKDGDRIVVFPGTYFEAINTRKRVEVCGEGPREKIVIVTTEEDAPTFRFGGTGGGVLRNLSLREMSQYGTQTIEIADHASLLVDGCDLTTRQNANAIYVVDHGSLTLRESRIHGVKGSAVYLRDDATATMQGNLMTDLGSCGVFVRHRSRFYLQSNTIQKASLGGVDVNDTSTGTIDGNVIQKCHRGGVVLYGQSHVMVKHNTICDCEYGMRSFEQSQVVLKNNTVSNNRVENMQGTALRAASDEEAARSSALAHPVPAPAPAPP